MGKRELIDLLKLTFRCLVIVVWLFLAVPCVCLRFVIGVFPDHTHLLFLLEHVLGRKNTHTNEPIGLNNCSLIY